jgi:murein L,D-transpeptidase YcbB/YkuD
VQRRAVRRALWYVALTGLAAFPASGAAQSLRSAAETRAAVASLVESERHPLLTWPDITRYVGVLKEASGADADGLFWFEDGRPHRALDGAIQAVGQAQAHGMEPSEFDAQTLATRWQQLQAGSGASAAEWAAFDTAVSVAVMRYLSSVHQGRVDPRVVGFDYDLASRRLDLLPTLRSARDEAGGLPAAVDRVKPQFPVYDRLRAALARYRRAASAGEPPVVPGLSGTLKKVAAGQPWAGSMALAARLRLVGDLATDASAPAASGGVPVYGGELVDAVKRFQERHALEPDGVIGAGTIAALNVPLARRVRQLELALERERWLPEMRRGPYLFVNVPLFRLWAFDPDTPDDPLRMNVVVGKSAGHATPIFMDQMEYVILRPYWNPPPSILRSEIVPKARRDAGYLDRQNMEIVVGGGPTATALAATPEHLDLVLKGKLTIRQKPGPTNSLGLAKFIFPNAENVYMHGTPAQQLFSRARRDFSHGCIRLEDPARLAEWVLRDDPQWTRERIVAAMNGASPTQVNLKESLSVILFYDTAYADSSGVVHFADDYYGHDAKLEAALAHGFPYPRMR